jgi:anti-anti-sigma factor
VIGTAVTHSAAHKASLSLPSRADRGGYLIAALGGELSIASASALREQLLDLLRAASHLILDLSAVEHADASGLAVLVGSARRARLLGGSLRLAGPSPQVARILAATGLDQHLNYYPTVRAAITGQPKLPEVIFPSATVLASSHRIEGVIAGVMAGAAAQPAMPAIGLSAADRPADVMRAASVPRDRRSGCGDGSAGPRPAATAAGRRRRPASR